MSLLLFHTGAQYSAVLWQSAKADICKLQTNNYAQQLSKHFCFNDLKTVLHKITFCILAALFIFRISKHSHLFAPKYSAYIVHAVNKGFCLNDSVTNGCEKLFGNMITGLH